MALNYYCPSNESEMHAFAIRNKYSIGTKEPQPVVEIDYDNLPKELVFYSYQLEEVQASDSVLLTIKKGLWGYDIFTNMRLQRRSATKQNDDPQ